MQWSPRHSVGVNNGDGEWEQVLPCQMNLPSPQVNKA